MRVPQRILGSSILVAISIAAIGAVSALLFVVGARSLVATEMADFVTIWVVLNTTVVALSAAFDQQGPRIVSRYDLFDGALFTHATVLPAAGGLISLLLLDVVSPLPRISLSAIAYVLAVSLWTGERSTRLAHGEFKQLVTSAVSVLITCALGLFIGTKLWGSSIETLFWSAALGNASGLIVFNCLPRTRKRQQFLRILPRNENLLAVSIAISSGSALALSSGTVVLASRWGLSPERVVALAGLVNLVRIPFMLLNSVSGPINVEIAKMFATGNEVGAFQMTVKWLIRILISTVIIAFGIVLSGRFLLAIFIGSDYEFELSFAVAVVTVEGLILMSGLARYLGISSGRHGVVVGQWVIGLVVFGLIGLLDALGEHRVVLASTVGSLSTATLSIVWILQGLTHQEEPSLSC